MRVIVTGASGFIGRQAVAALHALGHSVIAVGRGSPPSDDCQWIKADLLAPGGVEAIANSASADVLLHLAWTTRHGLYWNDLVNLEWLSATVELVTALAKRGTRRVCVAGTCFEYDWPEDRDCDEVHTNTATHTLYDAAKSSCNRVLAQITRQMGVSFSWARLFYLYGPAEHPERLVASVCRAVLAGEKARCSSGWAMRDFMDVRDAGAALARLAVSHIEGPVNIASGEAVLIRDVVLAIGKLAERPDLIALGEIPDRPGDPPRISACIARLRQEVRCEPAHSLEQGLRNALSYWQERRASQ
ncbi:nucleoside-diphosphate-sugar epimerase [Bradyrhizobium sp. AZCC 1578]|uniref:NAD-dependent epimerase/dehydratase family protein n=1 Tax=Bradyrhizobium sp. AZCC 1578 TaxID=3117027 RepID=UPI002FEEC6C2